MTQSDPPPPGERATPAGRERTSDRPGSQGRRNGFLERLADLRPGEGGAVGGASLSLAGIVAAHLALETARDTLFLTQLKPHALAFVYMAMAVLAALVTRFSTNVERLLGRSNALVLSLMIAAMGNTLFFVAGRSQALTFAFYLWVGLSGTLLLLQFWLFAAARFTPSQSRRLYGLVAAGGVLGAVGGGAISSAVTRWSSVETLLAVAALLQLLTAFWVTTAPPGTLPPEQERPKSFRESLEEMRRSPYVRRIVRLNLFATATLLLVDYVFKSVTASSIAPAELGRFLAQYYMAMNLLALALQLFIAMRVLQRAGTIITLSLLPVALLLSAGAPLFLGGVLNAALIAKGVDGALRHSLHRVSTELLFLPLSPAARTSSKALIDSLGTRGTQGLTAMFLLGLGAVGLDRPEILFLAIFVGAGAWLVAALSLRRHYLNQFRASLGKGSFSPAFHLDQLTLDGVEVVIESLSSRDEAEVLSAMALLEQAGRSGLIPALLLYHPSERIIARALEFIPSLHRRDWPPLAERLVEHSSSEVRLAAVRALGRFGYLEKLRPDSFSQPPIAATAAFFRADHLTAPLSDPHILELTGKNANVDAQRALLRTIAEFGSLRWGDVLLRLKDIENPKLARSLPRAMTRVRDPRFIPTLIARLNVREGSEDVRLALASLGNKALDGLEQALFDPATPLDLKMRLPKAIARFYHQKAAELLLKGLHSDLPGAARYRILLALCEMNARVRLRFSKTTLLPLVEQNGKEALRALLLAELTAEDTQHRDPLAQATGALLVALLRDKHEQSLDRITRLLQLLHRRENFRQVNHALRSRDPRARSAAGELLEVITLGYDERIRELLRALSEPWSALERHEHIMQLIGLRIDSATAALSDLLTDPDPAVSALAAEYAQQTNAVGLSLQVRDVLSSNPWLNAGLRGAEGASG